MHTSTHTHTYTNAYTGILIDRRDWIFVFLSISVFYSSIRFTCNFVLSLDQIPIPLNAECKFHFTLLSQINFCLVVVAVFVVVVVVDLHLI